MFRSDLDDPVKDHAGTLTFDKLHCIEGHLSTVRVLTGTIVQSHELVANPIEPVDAQAGKFALVSALIKPAVDKSSKVVDSILGASGRGVIGRDIGKDLVVAWG